MDDGRVVDRCVSEGKIEEIGAGDEGSGSPLLVERAHSGAGKAVFHANLLESGCHSNVVDFVRRNLVTGGVAAEQENIGSFVLKMSSTNGSNWGRDVYGRAAESDEARAHTGAAYDRRIEFHKAIMIQTKAMILREVLHAHIPTLTAESTVRDAVDKMDVYQFPALVIVDIDMKPIAVLTEGDLSREVARRDNFVSMAGEPAHIYATKEPTMADVNQEISDALHRMLASGLTILPVTDEGILAGVVLRVDLMQALMMDAAVGA